MADRWTAPTDHRASVDVPSPEPSEPTVAPRSLRRSRTLPGGRAVLGALLVTLAVVGVVATHLAATAAPSDRYLVATVDLAPGTLFGDAAAVQRSFRGVAVDLPADVAAAAVGVDDADQLVGRRLVGALVAGDLLLGSAISVAGADPGTTTFSFAVAPEVAVGGRLTAGERIDVLATVGTGAEATTAYVVRAAPLVDVRTAGGGLGGEQLQLTVELAEPTHVQALAHALATAQVVVVRAPDAGTEAPPPYRFDPTAPGIGTSEGSERS